MNWLIREKMFTYFYNKFRPVNCMHYINCGVNSSLHYSGCCIRSVAPWITVLSQHTLFTDRVIYKFICSDILWNKAPHTGPHHMRCTYTLCPFFGRANNTDGSVVGLMISMAIVCYGDSIVTKHFLRPPSVFQPIWGWDNLGYFQLPQSNSSPEGAWNFSGYIFFLAIASNYNGLLYLVSSVWLAQFQKPDATETWRSLQWQQNRSQAMMWLVYKIPAIRGCPRCF